MFKLFSKDNNTEKSAAKELGLNLDAMSVDELGFLLSRAKDGAFGEEFSDRIKAEVVEKLQKLGYSEDGTKLKKG